MQPPTISLSRVEILAFYILLAILPTTIPPADASVLGQLDPKCAPGGNFDLRAWSLQLPVGASSEPSAGPRIVSSKALRGCEAGYQDDGAYFFTGRADGSLVMRVPGSPKTSGCITTGNSDHCRTELREVDPKTGGGASWDPRAKVNRLAATLLVVAAGDKSTVVGQVHIDDKVSKKPICELYYAPRNGEISFGVEHSREGGQNTTKIGTVPPGQKFSFEIRYEGNVLSVILNGKSREFGTFKLNAPKSYFKAGNYNQGDTASEVHFFNISVRHEP